MDLRKSTKGYKRDTDFKARKDINLQTLYSWLERAMQGIQDQLNDLSDQVGELAELVEDSGEDSIEPVGFTN